MSVPRTLFPCQATLPQPFRVTTNNAGISFWSPWPHCVWTLASPEHIFTPVLPIMVSHHTSLSRQAMGRENQGSGKLNDECDEVLGENQGARTVRGHSRGTGKPRWLAPPSIQERKRWVMTSHFSSISNIGNSPLNYPEPEHLKNPGVLQLWSSCLLLLTAEMLGWNVLKNMVHRFTFMPNYHAVK